MKTVDKNNTSPKRAAEVRRTLVFYLKKGGYYSSEIAAILNMDKGQVSRILNPKK